MDKEIHHTQILATGRQFSVVIYRLTPEEAKTAGEKLGGVFRSSLVPNPANGEPEAYLHYGSFYTRALESMGFPLKVTIFQKTTLDKWVFLTSWHNE